MDSSVQVVISGGAIEPHLQLRAPCRVRLRILSLCPSPCSCVRSLSLKIKLKNYISAYVYVYAFVMKMQERSSIKGFKVMKAYSLGLNSVGESGMEM